MNIKNNEFDIKLLQNLFNLKKKRIITIFLSLMAIAIALLFFVVPSTFTSIATLLPPEQNSGGGLSSYLQNLSGAMNFSFGATNNIKSQIFSEMLKSRSLDEKVYDILTRKDNNNFAGMTKEEAVETIAALLSADIKKNGVIVIQAFYPTHYFPNKMKEREAAQFVSDLVNASTEALDSINKEKNVSLAHKSRIFIEKMLANNKNRIDSLQTILKEFQKNNKLVSLPDQMTATVKSAVDVGAELMKAKYELSYAQEFYEPSSDYLRVLKQRISNLESELVKAQNGGVSSADQISIALKNTPDLSIKYANIVRDLKILEQVNAYLESERYQESIQESRDVPTVIVLDKAVPSAKRDSPNRKLGLVLSFFISICIALGFEFTVAMIKGDFAQKNNE